MCPFCIDMRNCHAHRIMNPRRPADQPHGSRLRLVLPLTPYRLEARPAVPASHRPLSLALSKDRTAPLVAFEEIKPHEIC